MFSHVEPIRAYDANFYPTSSQTPAPIEVNAFGDEFSNEISKEVSKGISSEVSWLGLTKGRRIPLQLQFCYCLSRKLRWRWYPNSVSTLKPGFWCCLFIEKRM